MKDPMKKKLNKTVIGVIQMACSDVKKENDKKAESFIRKAAKAGANLICLPELYQTRYFCQTEESRIFDLAEVIPGKTVPHFQQLCKSLGVVLVLPVFEKRAPGLYHNSVVIIDSDGSVAGIYRKMHIPDDPAYYEKYYFTPGDLGFKNFPTRFGNVGTLICWDQWYPEGARITALQGSEVLFYPTAIGWHPKEIDRYGTAQRDSWITIQRSHAIANGVYVGSANRIGLEKPTAESDGILFWGSSFISDPQGVILSQAGTDTEEILTAELDRDHLETVRRNWPFLRDRRIDAYHPITNRFLD